MAPPPGEAPQTPDVPEFLWLAAVERKSLAGQALSSLAPVSGLVSLVLLLAELLSFAQ